MKRNILQIIPAQGFEAVYEGEAPRSEDVYRVAAFALVEEYDPEDQVEDREQRVLPLIIDGYDKHGLEFCDVVDNYKGLREIK